MRQTNDIGRSSGSQRGSGTRANALWGKGKRRYSLLLALAVLALAATAGASTSTAAPKQAAVPKELKKKAKDSPAETLSVIIQLADAAEGDAGETSVDRAQKKKPGKAKGTKKKFETLRTVVADVTGEQLEELASDENVIAISEDSEVRAMGYGNSQDWTRSLGTQWGKAPKGTEYPTIAIVDSGVQSRSDFGSRLVKRVTFVSDSAKNKGSGGDGYGHGTMVAGLASGGEDGFTGVEPRGKIVSLDVLDNEGSGRVSDVLAACDWILQHQERYNIRVANFSINAGSGLGVADDPLNKAVQKLWLNGIVVVAAAGNYAQNGAESGVGFAPANDPFVITVGASDTNKTDTTSDDFAAPWSAWGFTQDGFRKPEISAPGRFMVSAAPKDSALMASFPARKVESGYMWMSGTSFAAPLVAGAAASVLAVRPDWTPDQVKGALMVGAAVPTGYDSLGALGVGIVDIPRAIASDGTANPNAALNQFVITEPSGLRAFDASTWTASAMADATWGAASWSSASWSSASWSSASWSSASWSSASWSSASWSSASWSSASWASNVAVE